MKSLKNIVVGLGLLSLIAVPVFANEPTTAPTEEHPAADSAHPGHPEKAPKAKKAGKKAKKAHKEAHPADAHPTDEHPAGN